MSALQDATEALREIEPALLASQQGELDLEVARRIPDIVRLLALDQPRWIGTAKARRLLGIELEGAVATWARWGLLRSRTLPDGRLEVRLDDVLYRRAEREALIAIGGDELTPEELRVMNETGPGPPPWERDRGASSA